MNNINCKICNKLFNSTNELLHHNINAECFNLMTVDSEYIYCVYCASVICLNEYKLHYDKCNKKTKYIENIHKHIRCKKDEQIDKISSRYIKYSCNKCLTLFSQTCSLSRHNVSNTCIINNDDNKKCIWCMYAKSWLNDRLVIASHLSKNALNTHLNVCVFKQPILCIFVINSIIELRQDVFNYGMLGNLYELSLKLINLLELDVINIAKSQVLNKSDKNMKLIINSPNNIVNCGNNNSVNNITNNGMIVYNISCFIDDNLNLNTHDKESLIDKIVKFYADMKHIKSPCNINVFPKFDGNETQLNLIPITLDEYCKIFESYKYNLSQINDDDKNHIYLKRNYTKNLFIELIKKSRFDGKYPETLNIIVSSYEIDKQKLIELDPNNNSGDILPCPTCGIDRLDLSNTDHLKHIISVIKNARIKEYNGSEWKEYSYERFCIIIKNIFDLLTLSVKVLMSCGKLDIREDEDYEAYRNCMRVVKQLKDSNNFRDYLSYCIVMQCEKLSVFTSYLDKVKFIKHSELSNDMIKSYKIGLYKINTELSKKADDIYNEKWNGKEFVIQQKNKIPNAYVDTSNDNLISIIDIDNDEDHYQVILQHKEDEKITKQIKMEQCAIDKLSQMSQFIDLCYNVYCEPQIKSFN